ncbi:MAG: STAS-like domain-containing protein [Chthoniobacterales bacterium]|jgi:hypothetical protein
MKAIFRMEERFGSFLANGDVANAFRFTEVEPALAEGKSVVLDFGGVTNMTSSFCNALVATLVAHHVEDFAERIRFANCDALIRQMILGAVSLGRREAKEFA